MTSILARLKAFMDSNSKDSVESLEDAISELKLELLLAQEKAVSAAENHKQNVLAGNGLDESRKKVDDAEASIKDIQIALAAFESKLVSARSKNAKESASEQMEHAKALMAQRLEHMKNLQRLANELADELDAVMSLNEKAWQAFPVKPTFRPQGWSRDITGLLSLYLYGVTDGKICQFPISPYVALKRPSLVESAIESEKIFIHEELKDAA